MHARGTVCWESRPVGLKSHCSSICFDDIGVTRVARMSSTRLPICLSVSGDCYDAWQLGGMIAHLAATDDKPLFMSQ